MASFKQLLVLLASFATLLGGVTQSNPISPDEGEITTEGTLGDPAIPILLAQVGDEDGDETPIPSVTGAGGGDSTDTASDTHADTTSDEPDDTGDDNSGGTSNDGGNDEPDDTGDATPDTDADDGTAAPKFVMPASKWEDDNYSELKCKRYWRKNAKEDHGSEFPQKWADNSGYWADIFYEEMSEASKSIHAPQGYPITENSSFKCYRLTHSQGSINTQTYRVMNALLDAYEAGVEETEEGSSEIGSRNLLEEAASLAKDQGVSLVYPADHKKAGKAMKGKDLNKVLIPFVKKIVLEDLESGKYSLAALRRAKEVSAGNDGQDELFDKLEKRIEALEKND